MTVEEAFPEAITSSSKYILLGAGGAANDAINVGSIGVDLTDENTIAGGSTIASEAGPLAVTAINAQELTMDVLIRKHIFLGA